MLTTSSHVSEEANQGAMLTTSLHVSETANQGAIFFVPVIYAKNAQLNRYLNMESLNV